MTETTRIANDRLAIDIADLGAEMQSLVSSDGRSFLWNGDSRFWSGRAPVLFPMVGRAPEDRISIDGTIYPMNQHGFARRQPFARVAATQTACRHRLAANDETRAVYPFDFRLDIEHALHGATLTVSAEVANDSPRTMPFGIGFHPAFAWPLPGAEGQAHHVWLDNGAEPALQRLEGGLVHQNLQPSPFSAGQLVLDHALFEDDAMIFPEGAGTGLRYGCANGPQLHFAFDNLPNLALWTKPGAPFLCIEPWHGTAAEHGGSNDLARRPYTSLLEPGQTMRFGYALTLVA